MNHHPKDHPAEEKLSAFLDGDLAADEAGQIRQHLEECPQCRQNLDDFRQLKTQLSVLAKVQAPESLWQKVRLSLSEQQPIQNSSGWRRWNFWGWTLSLAATAAGLAWLAFIFLYPADESTPYEALMAVQKAEAEYQRAIENLSTSIEQSEELSPEIKKAVAENAAIIDKGIEEVRQLIKQHPRQLELRQSMLALYQKKVDLLSKAVLELP